MYDPVIARWRVPDPLAHELTWQSPFGAFNNNPIYFTDPDGKSVRPATEDARVVILNQLNTFKENETLNLIFGNYKFSSIGTYNDPNDPRLNKNQDDPILGFTLPGMHYGEAKKLLNADKTGLTQAQKLEALSWVRALTALDVAEVGVYNNDIISEYNTEAKGENGQISINSSITNNPVLKTFYSGLTNANNTSQIDAIINSLVSSATTTTTVPFLPNVTPSIGNSAPNIKSEYNQTANIYGLYPIAGSVTTAAPADSKAIQDFGLYIGPVSVPSGK